MCGIAGFVQTEARWGQAELDRMSAAIAHRGPDGASSWNDGTVYLAHRRLAILDLSDAASQPMTSACGRFRIVYNGEIYNAPELARRWGLNLRTRSDTETLLEGLARHGTAALPALNGMFAFALWDERERSLLLARDAFGIKPLLYHFQNGTLAFASEMKSLLALPIDRRLNLQALQDYLFLEHVPGPQSIWEDVHRLEPGTWLRWQAGRIESGRFSDLTELALADRLPEAQARAEAEDRFRAAVERHLLSDAPAGCFLSGGVDSSLVAAAARLQMDSLPAFTLGFDVPSYDETEAARAVAQALNLRPHLTETLTEERAWEEVETLARWCDEPFAVPSVMPTSAVARLAAGSVKVALAGEGGDELFMGYGYYNWHERMSKLAPWGGAGRRAARLLLGAGRARERRAARLFAMPEPTGGVDWPHLWSQEQGQFTEAEIARLTGRPCRSHWFRERWAALQALRLHPWERIALLDLQAYLPYDLMYKADISAMRWGLEARVPMLDGEWAAFALRLPLSLRRDAGRSKILLKELLARRLPPELVHRRKWGFPAPMDHWMQGRWGALIDRYLDEKELKRAGLFDPEEVRRYVDAFRRGDRFHYKRLWALVFFELWRREWME